METIKNFLKRGVRYGPALALLAFILVQAAMLSPKVCADIGDMWTIATSAGTSVWRITSGGDIVPGTTNTYSIGTSSLKVKDLLIAGTATLPTITATNLDGILGANTPAAATATTLTATGNVTMNDAGADTLLLGAAADTVTITGDTSITDTQWSVTAAGLANFAAWQAANAVFNTSTATDDQIKITPQAGGAGRFSGSITTADLTADRTYTFPDSAGTVSLLGNAVTGSGSVVLATSPTLTTPTIGVATATSINKVALTAPATAATITITDGKTLAVSNTLTLAGTDGTTMTFPATSGTVLTADSTATLTNKTLTAPVIATISNTGTLTLPTSTDTLVGRATTDTLTNKTLTAPALNGTVTTSGLTMPAFSAGGAITAAAGIMVNLDNGTGSCTGGGADDGAVTIDKQSGIITTEAITTAADGTYTITLANARIASTSNVMVTCGFGTSTAGRAVIEKVTPGSGTCTIIVRNYAGAAAFNGTLLVQFIVAN